MDAESESVNEGKRELSPECADDIEIPVEPEIRPSTAKRTYSEYDDEDFDPSQIKCTRRQPRRFVHSKPFSNGLADHATADWLRTHFHTKQGSLVPKGFLCARYEEYCQNSNRKPMNNATLGRFIRGVFRGLETRRLGARQQSRYFYNNLAVRPTSPYVNMILTDIKPNIGRVRPNPGRDFNESQDNVDINASQPLIRTTTRKNESIEGFPQFIPCLERRQALLGKYSPSLFSTDLISLPDIEASINRIKLGSSAQGALFTGDFTMTQLEMTQSAKDLLGFAPLINRHILSLAVYMLTLEKDGIEPILQNFWHTHDLSVQIIELVNEEAWRKLCNKQQFQTLIQSHYLTLYEELLQLYVSDILQPAADGIWERLWEITNKFPLWLDAATRSATPCFRGILTSDCLAFTACLKERLVLIYSASHVRLLLPTDVGHNLATSIENHLRPSLMYSMAELDPNYRPMFRQSFELFGRFTSNADLLEEWRKWLQGSIHDIVIKLPPEDDVPTTLNNLLQEWTIFLVQMENDFPTFAGAELILPALFLILNGLVSETVNSVLLGTSPNHMVDPYRAGIQGNLMALESADSNVHPFNAEAQGYGTTSANTVVEDALPFDLKDETPFRKFSCLSGILYGMQKVDPQQTNQKAQRVSGRRGKGRNRFHE